MLFKYRIIKGKYDVESSQELFLIDNLKVRELVIEFWEKEKQVKKPIKYFFYHNIVYFARYARALVNQLKEA